MNKDDYITLYLCNGENPECPKKGFCKSQNYPVNCKHTSSTAAAQFDLCEEPWRHPDRFKTIVPDDGKIQFWERIPIDQLYHYHDNIFLN